MVQTNSSILPNNIRQIDTLHLGRPQAIASYLLMGEQPALVDPGPASALPGLEAGLAANGLSIRDLSALLLTHIHLDHAGATGTLVRRNPNIQVFVHQRGAPHMVDPAKLLRSATRLYGDRMDYLWGEFLATPADNVTALSGGETIELGDREFVVYDAPGHASHHVLYHEEASGALWVGDNAGVRMSGFAYPRPATPPPDIDLEGWEKTLARMERLEPAMLLLTHFGAFGDAQHHVAELRRHMAEWSEAVRDGIVSGTDEAAQVAALQALATADLGTLASPEAIALYGNAAPIDQCWQGLARYWKKKLGML
jgi:glyoxylase-like metal-dependent hydrolase (beta-lactamase superfamily II)